MRAAHDLIKLSNHSNFDLSELRNAIGMMELAHGSQRKAKAWLGDSLLDPSENSIAQFIFVNENLLRVQEKPTPTSPLDFEAKSRTATISGDLNSAAAYAKDWMDLEPYSSRPLIMRSFALNMLGRYEEAAIEFDNNRDFLLNNTMLLNNAVVTYLNAGKIELAKSLFTDLERRTDLDRSTSICRLATRALLSFRSGDLSQGRLQFKEVLEQSANSGLAQYRIRAMFIWSCEELNAGQTDQVIIADTLSHLKQKHTPEDSLLLSRLTDLSRATRKNH